MKYRLAFDDFEINGYKLISPLRGVNPIKIGQYIDDGEASEIICEDILDYVPTDAMFAYIRTLSTKLQHGGTLTITGKDIEILSEKYLRGELNIIEFNKLIFGVQNHSWNFKLSSITLGDLNDICNRLGLKILERKLNDYIFCIKVQRP